MDGFSAGQRMTVTRTLTSLRRRALYDEAARWLDLADEHAEYAATCRQRALRLEHEADAMSELEVGA